MAQARSLRRTIPKLPLLSALWTWRVDIILRPAKNLRASLGRFLFRLFALEPRLLSAIRSRTRHSSGSTLPPLCRLTSLKRPRSAVKLLTVCAGLVVLDFSASLTDRHNGVHIAFGHRIIETTREPFGGESAPTLYCEVALDASTPWKHSLSEHKDKVVRNRDELMASIQKQITPLLKKSSQQAAYLALKMMAAPIEAQLTRALKAAGILHVDPDEDPLDGGGRGDGPGPVKRGKKLHTPVDDGDPARP